MHCKTVRKLLSLPSSWLVSLFSSLFLQLKCLMPFYQQLMMWLLTLSLFSPFFTPTCIGVWECGLVCVAIYRFNYCEQSPDPWPASSHDWWLFNELCIRHKNRSGPVASVLLHSPCRCPSPDLWAGWRAVLAITARSTHPSLHLPHNLGLGQRGRGKRRH